MLNARLELNLQGQKKLKDANKPKIGISKMETYWKQIIDALPVIISRHDSIGYISFNKYGSNLTGYSEDEWINMPIDERSLIFDFPAKPETLIYFEMFSKQGKNPEKDIVELEFKLKTKEGKWIWLFSTNTYIFNPDKNDFEILIAAIDVTERKNHEIEIEKLNNELESLLIRERNLAGEKQEWMEQQISEKNRELNRLAVYLTEKNNCLLKLKNQAASLANASIKDLKKTAKQIIKSIDEKLNNQSVWNTFEIQFEAANPNYIHNLLKIYPELSHKEIKVCTLIKLDLSTKAISTILNLSTRTIDAHRYSIRKKMQLNKNDQLSVILNSVDAQIQNT